MIGIFHKLKFLAAVTLVGMFFVCGITLVASAEPNIGIGGTGMASEVAKGGGYDTQGVTDTTLSESIGRIIKIALSLVGTVFLVLTMYAGVLWMTASGNEEQVESATKILRAAVLGLFIVVGAYGIVVFVLIAVTTSAGTPTQIGNAGIGAGGFWSSFGSQMKTHWSDYVFP